jgi:hypothetical protein
MSPSYAERRPSWIRHWNPRAGNTVALFDQAPDRSLRPADLLSSMNTTFAVFRTVQTRGDGCLLSPVLRLAFQDKGPDSGVPRIMPRPHSAWKWGPTALAQSARSTHGFV